jgi:hypothetical protein
MTTKREFFDALNKVGALVLAQTPLTKSYEFVAPLTGLRDEGRYAKFCEIALAFADAFLGELSKIPGSDWVNNFKPDHPPECVLPVNSMSSTDIQVSVNLPPYYGYMDFVRYGQCAVNLRNFQVSAVYEHVLRTSWHGTLFDLIRKMSIDEIVLGDFEKRDDALSEKVVMTVDCTFDDFLMGYSSKKCAIAVDREMLIRAHLKTERFFDEPSTPADFSDLEHRFEYHFREELISFRNLLEIKVPEAYEAFRQQIIQLYASLVLADNVPLNVELHPFYVKSAHGYTRSGWPREYFVKTSWGEIMIPFSCVVHLDGNTALRKKVDVALESKSEGTIDVYSCERLSEILDGISQRFI